MSKQKKYRKLVVNMLIATLLTVLLNFAYLVMLMVSRTGAPESEEPKGPRVEQTTPQIDPILDIKRHNDLSLNPYDEDQQIEADSLKGAIIIREESMTEMNRHRSPQQLTSDMWNSYMLLDLFYIFAVAMVMLTVMTDTVSRKRNTFALRMLVCFVLLVIFFVLAPQMSWRGDIFTTLHHGHIFFNPMSILKLAATYVVAVLYGKIYELHYRQREIEVENEKLKNESLSWQYTTLVNQVNPHFLFNSLNSLSMLVREGDTAGAQTYIDRMSDTYRYIISEGKSELTTLADELEFVEAYRYLLEVRYEGKLHIIIDVDDRYSTYELPALSIQPLIENAVKHNTITSACPMEITITANDGYVEVRNRVAPKIDPPKSTGIGLRNLANRYELITGRQVVVEQTDGYFVVKLPIQRPTKS